jgi:hypothetical protein
MDPEYIKSMPIKPHDQTSNQLWVDIQLGHESNAELLAQTAKELKNQGWLAIYTRMVRICPWRRPALVQESRKLNTVPNICIFAGCPDVQEKHQFDPRPSPSPDLTLQSLRHRSHPLPCSPIRSGVRTSWHWARQVLHQNSVYGSCLECSQDPE